MCGQRHLQAGLNSKLLTKATSVLCAQTSLSYLSPPFQLIGCFVTMLSISSLGIARTSASPAPNLYRLVDPTQSPAPRSTSRSRVRPADPPEESVFGGEGHVVGDLAAAVGDAKPFFSRLNRLARTPAGDEWRVLLAMTGAGAAGGVVALARGDGVQTFSLSPALPAAFAGAVSAAVGDWGRASGLLLLHCAAGVALVELPPAIDRGGGGRRRGRRRVRQRRPSGRRAWAPRSLQPCPPPMRDGTH